MAEIALPVRAIVHGVDDHVQDAKGRWLCEADNHEIAGAIAAALNDHAALQAQVAALEAERDALRKACVQARGALLLDAMVDDEGRPYGTTWVALQAIAEALGERAIVGGAAEGGAARG